MLGILLGLGGVVLGGWLAVDNGADVRSLLLTGVIGAVVGLGLAFTSGRVFVIGFAVALVGGLLVHLKYAASVAPLWPFVLLLGLVVHRQLERPGASTRPVRARRPR